MTVPSIPATKHCVIPYCSAVIVDDNEHESELIMHLITGHGWVAILELLRDGCIYDCDRCHME